MDVVIRCFIVESCSDMIIIRTKMLTAPNIAMMNLAHRSTFYETSYENVVEKFKKGIKKEGIK